MRYSIYNAIPQYPKSKKHPYESLENLRIFTVIFRHLYNGVFMMLIHVISLLPSDILHGIITH